MSTWARWPGEVREGEFARLLLRLGKAGRIVLPRSTIFELKTFLASLMESYDGNIPKEGCWPAGAGLSLAWQLESGRGYHMEIVSNENNLNRDLN